MNNNFKYETIYDIFYVCTLLGYLPNLWTMMVALSPRRRATVIKFIIVKRRLLLGKRASIRDIARILGLLQSSCDIYVWG